MATYVNFILKMYIYVIVTTLEQRLQHPEVQTEKINELRPQHRQFLVKRSQRCRVCEHNVSKSDLCPQSTKFKILLAAL